MEVSRHKIFPQWPAIGLSLILSFPAFAAPFILSWSLDEQPALDPLNRRTLRELSTREKEPRILTGLEEALKSSSRRSFPSFKAGLEEDGDYNIVQEWISKLNSPNAIVFDDYAEMVRGKEIGVFIAREALAKAGYVLTVGYKTEGNRTTPIILWVKKDLLDEGSRSTGLEEVDGEKRKGGGYQAVWSWLVGLDTPDVIPLTDYERMLQAEEVTYSVARGVMEDAGYVLVGAEPIQGTLTTAWVRKDLRDERSRPAGLEEGIRRLLVVEDSPSVLDRYKKDIPAWAQKDGREIEVVYVDSLAGAFKVLEQKGQRYFDAVITDGQLVPGYGWNLATSINPIEKGKEDYIPVAIVTSYPRYREEIEEALASGQISHYYRKFRGIAIEEILNDLEAAAIARAAAGLEETGQQVADLKLKEPYLVDRLEIFYRREETGNRVWDLLMEAESSNQKSPNRIPGLKLADVYIRQWDVNDAPPPQTIFVVAPGEIIPETYWKDKGVAIVTLSPGMTFAQIIQKALSQWNGHPVGEIQEIQHRDGKLAISA